MPDPIQASWALAQATVRKALADDVPSLSAAIAYYTIFSLPPLLVFLIGVAGVVFGADVVREALLGQAGGMIGPEASAAFQTMIENAGSLGEGLGAKLVGIVVLLVGATGAFGQLQKALNRAWDVTSSEGGLVGLVRKRLLSFGIVLTIAGLLFASLAVSTTLASLGQAVSDAASSALVETLIRLLNELVSLGIVTSLFALMFKMLPDATTGWKEVWVGGLVTAVLFTIGKAAIGVYLGTANPGSAFGAAGALALILVWIYYSSLIVLIGAEFTHVWATRRNGAEPDGEASTR